MWFNSSLASWKSVPSRRRRQEPRPARRGICFALEHLDDRVLLTSYSAANVTALIADLSAANKHGGSNTITLTAPTTSPYGLPGVDNTTDGANGLPVIAANDSLTIVGSGDTIEPSPTGSYAGRFFDVAPGASLTLESMTLLRGLCLSVSLSDQPADGGAIYNQGALTLNGVTVQNCIAQGEYSAWTGGTVSGYGGGIWSNGSVTLENGTLLEGNQALGCALNSTQPGDGYGGALYVAGGTVNITNTTFTSNGAYSGLDTEPGLNAGNAFGGAIYIAAGNVVLTTTTVSNSFVSYPRIRGAGSGTTYEGGGLYVAGGTVSLTNDTLDSNKSREPGGGLYVAGGTVTLVNDTVESNYAAPAGGGIYIASGATVYVDAFMLANTINNTANVDPNIDGTYIET